MDVLKLATAGSVDDGKSTLIGRLLYDTESLTTDRLEAVKKASQKKGLPFLDLSLLTDGLVAEREQGITIDVAHIYFNTQHRKYILADTPGHIEYTRNMITGASNAELSLILIDARKGVIEQTYRHFFITTLLQIPNVVVCINKMDLVDYSEEVFYRIAADFQKVIEKVKNLIPNNSQTQISFIPLSALNGDNVAKLSKNMDWYAGKALLQLLEEVELHQDLNQLPARFPVQYVIRQNEGEFIDYRGYAGKITSGSFAVGDEVVVLPQQLKTTITNIQFFENSLLEAFANDSVSISLADEIDISRGSVLVKSNQLPQQNNVLEAHICWLNEDDYRPNSTFILKHATTEVKAKLQTIDYKIDIEHFTKNETDKNIRLNDIGKVSIRTAQPIFYDKYADNKTNGAFILIDSQTNATVAVGFLL